MLQGTSSVECLGYATNKLMAMNPVEPFAAPLLRDD